MSLERGEGDPADVVHAHSRTDADQGDARMFERARCREQRERRADEQDHQSGEHVQLRVEVHDHVARIATAVEQLVDRGERLDGTLQRADRKRAAAEEDERPQLGPALRNVRRSVTAATRTPANIAMPAPMIRNGCSARCLLRLLGRQAVPDDQAPFVKAEVERHAVEGERADEQREEARFAVFRAGATPPSSGASANSAPARQHRQPRDEVDVRVADRIDPLAGVPGAVEPVGVRRLHLEHALHGPDREPGRARREELPEVAARLRHANEPGPEDREEHVAGEAPVADSHDSGADPDRHPVGLAHVQLGCLVVPATGDEAADCDAVRDQGDVEDERDRRP